MLDLTKVYCLKSNVSVPLTIRGVLKEEFLNTKMRSEGIEAGDYICYWLHDNNPNKPKLNYAKEHQLQEHKPEVTTYHLD